MREQFAKSRYHFIPFPKTPHYIKGGLEALPSHGIYDSSKNTGYIEYSLTAETPIFVSNGNKNDADFCKNINGKYAIPGSTLKGMVRSNSEVLSHAYPEFVCDARFSFREVATEKSSIQKEYKKYINTNDNRKINNVVKVGLLVNENDRYHIVPFDTIKNYDNTSNEAAFQFIHNNAIKNASNSQINFHDLDRSHYKPYILLGKMTNNVHINNRLSSKSLDTFTNVKSVEELKTEDVKLLKNESGQWVIFMNSNKMRGKKKHYLFKGDLTDERVDIDGTVIAEYRSRSKRIKGNTEDFGEGQKKQKTEYYDLPSKGNAKPCFYLDSSNGNCIAIGFTPYMRIPYQNGITQGLPKKPEENRIDMSNAIFGFTGYASRVRFEDAETDVSSTGKPIYVNLLNPKPTSFQMYLNQNGPNKEQYNHYNSEDFTLRGQKFYWLREEIDPVVFSVNANRTAETTLKPLDKGTVFNGKIHFTNLSDTELGLLLYSLKLDDRKKEDTEGYVTYDSIGQGKPFGFGRVLIHVNKLAIANLNARYLQNDGSFIDKEPLAYKKQFLEHYNKEISPELPFMHLDNKIIWAYRLSKELPQFDTSDFEYMAVGEFRKRPMLKDVQAYIDEIPYRKFFQSKHRETGNHGKPQKSQIDLESWLQSKVPFAVISNSKQDENRVKLLMRNYENVTYVLKEEFMKKYNWVIDAEVVVFNNLNGSKPHSDYKIIEKLAEDTKEKVYFYFNDRNERLDNALLSGVEFQSFANTPVQFMPNLLNLLDFWRKMKDE